MFWRVAGYSQPSPIEAILDKESYTLEELLDEDDLIQEVKSLNSRLIEYLQQGEVVEQLVKYLTEGPGDSDDPKRQFKYPYAACEIFSCEVDGVFATLLDNKALMGKLFGFLDTDQPLNSALAGYFGRVVGSLIMRRTADLMSYIKDNQHIMEWLMNHLRTTSIAEVVVQLVGSDEQSYAYYGNHHMYWLADTTLMQMLIERLSAEYPPDTQSNAADILAAIAHTQPSPLASKLATWEYMEMLFQRALDPAGSAVLVPTLNVCTALLDPKRVQTEQGMGMGMGMGMGGGMDGGPQAPSSPVDNKLKEAAVQGILKEMPRLVALLQHDDGEHIPLETAFGKLDARLGSRRWKVVELLSVLAHQGGAGVEEALIGVGAIQTCQTLFLQFPFNNLLHHSVGTLVCACLEGSPAMMAHLLQDCDLPSWLASAPPLVAHSNGAAPLRAGYMGHVTMMGNALLEVAKQRPDAAAVLAGKQQWALFVSTTLKERNELENTAKWACGRPTAMGAGMDTDNEEEFQSDMDLETLAKTHEVYRRYEDEDGEDEFDQEDDAERFKEATEAFEALQVAEHEDADSSDSEEGAEAVMPVSGEAAAGDDDGMVLLESEEDADMVIGVDQSPESKPATEKPAALETSIATDLSPCTSPFSKAAGLSPVQHLSPKGQATAVLDDAGAEYNNFQFWKAGYLPEIPDDL